MPDQQPNPYQRATERFRAYGVDLNSPLDSIRPGYYPVLENVRCYTDGVIQPRQGLSAAANGAVITNKTPVHSVRRLNDPNTAGAFNYIRLIGAGDSLAWYEPNGQTFAQSQYNSINAVFSGNPLTMVPFRPDQSISSWMYIADSTAMYKSMGYNGQGIARGTLHKIGVAPPTAPPTVELGSLQSGNFVSFGALGASPNQWTKDNIVLTTAPSVVRRIPAALTTTRALYDSFDTSSSRTGWISLVLPTAAMSAVGIGSQLGVSTSNFIIQGIYTGSSTTGITVANILYDVGSTGFCIIQPDRAVEQIVRNSVVFLNATVYARVTDIITNPDGTFAFRCNTGASTVASTQSIQVVPSVRVFDPNTGSLTVAGGDALGDAASAAGAISTAGAGIAGNKIGWVQITPATAFDLTRFSSAFSITPSGALTDNDYLHMSFQISDVSKLSQGRIMFDVDNTSVAITSSTAATPIVVTLPTGHSIATGDTVFIQNHTVNTNANGTWTASAVTATTITLLDGATNSVGNGVGGATGTVQAQFKKNFYYRAFSASDLTAAVKGTQTALDNRASTISRVLTDSPAPPPLRRFFNPHIRNKDEGGSGDFGDRGPTTPNQSGIVRGSSDPNAPDVSDPSRSQAGSGDNQWFELFFRVGDLKRGRAGTDVSRGLSSINALRLEFAMTDTSSFTVNFNSLSAWGSFEPDVSDLASPYIYRFRYRVSTTGAVSNWSPACRSGLLPQRGQDLVSCGPTSANEVDKIDIQRLGGINTTWLTVGSTTNTTATLSVSTISNTTPIQLTTTASHNLNDWDVVTVSGVSPTGANGTWTVAKISATVISLNGSVAAGAYVSGGTLISATKFTDKISDGAAAGLAPLSDLDTNYQPWPLLQKPASGTTAASGVVGPYIKDVGTNFNTGWAKGTPIKINGIDTTIRRVISTSVMEVEDSQGSQSSVSWEIPEPLLISQPLPSLWEWNSRAFACGDTANPGILYWSNGNSFDTTTDTSRLEITSPSEPLVNGCSYNGKNYVWSSERMFEIEQLLPGMFIAIQLPGVKGLFSRWALAVGERMWWLSKDGIYQSNGGESICITDEHLRPLFVKEGNVGIAVNGFLALTTQSTGPASFRLSYYDGYLYFVYLDNILNYRCLTRTVKAEKPGWWPDTYPGASISGVTYFYGDEGQSVHSLLACGNNATTGKLYSVLGAADDGANISCHVRTQYFDGQDRRAEKRWGDFILDADANAATLNLICYVNAGVASQLTLTPTTMSTSGRTQLIVDLSSGGDPVADYSRNMALDIAWNSQLTPQLFLWEPSYSIRPESTDLRATLWDDAGVQGDKFFQGIELTVDTQNIARTISIEADGPSGFLADTLTVQHNGKQLKSYAFRPAFSANTVRLHPTDGANTWRIYNYKWIFQPEPPLGERWETQQTSLGAEQFVHMKAAYITLKSTQTVLLTVTRTEDGTATTYTIPTTSGNKQKVYVPFQAPASKGKTFSFILSSTATGGQFRLYKDDTTVLAKPWQSEDAYSNRNPFGAPHGDGQAPI